MSNLPTRPRWRDYTTRSGHRPVRDFIRTLSDADAAAVVAAMREVAVEGLSGARHLHGDIYEVRVVGDGAAYRVLFATEGRRAQILLALEAFAKTSQKTPPRTIQLAERRLRDWRSRSVSRT